MQTRSWVCAAAILVAWSGGAGAQDRVLRGRIVARGTQAPVTNAAVRPVGGGAGICTAEDGSFAVVVPAGAAWLELGVPGWVGRVPVDDAAQDITLELDPHVVPIEPLVVAAARKEAERDGASRAELRPSSGGAAPDVRSLLQGRVPGALVLAGSGTTGSGFRLILRGLSSVTGSNEPLVVVDDVVMGSRSSPTDPFSAGLSSSPGGLQDLNPDDIERIEILRGPAASSRYGSLGMHGVVLVTTKHGLPAPRPIDDSSRPSCPGWP